MSTNTLTKLEIDLLNELHLIVGGWKKRAEGASGTNPLNGWEEERYNSALRLIHIVRHGQQ